MMYFRSRIHFIQITFRFGTQLSALRFENWSKNRVSWCLFKIVPAVCQVFPCKSGLSLLSISFCFNCRNFGEMCLESLFDYCSCVRVGYERTRNSKSVHRRVSRFHFISHPDKFQNENFPGNYDWKTWTGLEVPSSFSMGRVFSISSKMMWFGGMRRFSIFWRPSLATNAQLEPKIFIECFCMK